MNGDSQSMGPEENGGPFLAGWMDGNHAGRCTVLRTFRRSAATYGLTCDDRGRVFNRSQAAPLSEVAIPSRDNPEADPDYDRGFDRGLAEVVERLGTELVLQTVPLGLFVARGGFVMSLHRAQDLVFAGVPQLPESAALTDEALHAFLDSELAAPGGASATMPQPGPDPQVPPKARATREVTWRPDRRALVGFGVGAAMMGTLVRLLGGHFLPNRSPGAPGSGRAQAGGGYVAPAWWDDLPLDVRDFFLAWDQLVWSLEQTPQGTANLHAALQTFLSSQGYDELKRNILTFFHDSRRTAYHWDLLYALLPGSSSAPIHGMVFACLGAHVAEFGPSVLDPGVVNGLLIYRNQGLAPNASCLEAVNLVLTMVGQ